MLAAVVACFAAFAALIAYVPGAVLVLLVIVGLVVASTILVGVAVSTQIPPLRPVAEISILGKHVVGFGKLLVALLAFFGSTALTWVIALNVTVQGASQDLSRIQGQLGPLLTAMVAFIAYAFWMWIAIDLTRAGKTRRREAADSLSDRLLGPLEGTGMDTVIRWCLRWIAGGPWWQMIFSFYAAPPALILFVSSLQLG